MSKILYNTSTQSIISYPRIDDFDIIGLDSSLTILTLVESSPPSYNLHTHTLRNEYVVDLELREYRKEWIIEEIPVTQYPNWDMFNTQMLTDPDFNQVYNTSHTIAPVIVTSLPAALVQVADGKLSMFSIIWGQIMQLGQATPIMREKWGQWAENNNLPEDFVDIIKG
jgi:hypothetical protein